MTTAAMETTCSDPTFTPLRKESDLTSYLITGNPAWFARYKVLMGEQRTQTGNTLMRRINSCYEHEAPQSELFEIINEVLGINNPRCPKPAQNVPEIVKKRRDTVPVDAHALRQAMKGDNYTAEGVATSLGVSVATFYNKLKDPELREIWDARPIAAKSHPSSKAKPVAEKAKTAVSIPDEMMHELMREVLATWDSDRTVGDIRMELGQRLVQAAFA